jgi:hypothetical protein
VYQTIALVGAICFAVAAVLQQKGTLDVPAGEDDPHFLVQAIRQPVWLAGAGLLVAGWILQALALNRGPLMVVQAIIALNLVIALPFGIWITQQVVHGREWIGAAATVAGIVVFLSVGTPSEGTDTVSAPRWWISGLIVVAAVVGLAKLGYQRKGPAKAALLGAAAGVAYAFQASVTKVFVGVISGGISAILHSWSTYVLIASALVGGVLQQTSLKTGVLAPAMSSCSAITLFGSIILGAVVFGERLAHGGGKFVPAIVGLVVALGGIVMLAGSNGVMAGPESSAAPT